DGIRDRNVTGVQTCALPIFDYQTKLKLEDLVWELLRLYSKTSILVTHDIGEAIAMSDRIMLMDTNPGSIAKTFEVPVELRHEKRSEERRVGEEGIDRDRKYE